MAVDAVALLGTAAVVNFRCPQETERVAEFVEEDRCEINLVERRGAVGTVIPIRPAGIEHSLSFRGGAVDIGVDQGFQQGDRKPGRAPERRIRCLVEIGRPGRTQGIRFQPRRPTGVNGDGLVGGQRRSPDVGSKLSGRLSLCRPGAAGIAVQGLPGRQEIDRDAPRGEQALAFRKRGRDIHRF